MDGPLRFADRGSLRSGRQRIRASAPALWFESVRRVPGDRFYSGLDSIFPTAALIINVLSEVQMRLVTTDAIVLRSYNLAEADRIVVCLTRSVGLVRAVAKGARRMKSRFGAALEPFTLIRLSFHERENRDLVALSSAEILTSYFNLNSRVESAELLAYMGELVAEFAPPHEADERLFRMLAACIESLAGAVGNERSVLSSG